MNWEIFGIWIGAFLTLCLFSFLYKDNPFYKFAEHLFVGMSAGYWVIYAIFTTLIPNWWNRLFGLEGEQSDLLMIIPGMFAIFMLTRLIPKISGVSRLAIAMIVGTGAGLQLVSYMHTDALAQVEGTIVSLTSSGNIWGLLNNLLLVTGVVCGLLYFFFSKPHKGLIGGGANIGITVLMVAFGASFGYTVMARISLLIGRAQFLLFEWLPTMGIEL